ncbi:MAG: radical SAM protein [Alphaproteobacteria bacterium]
MKVLMISVPLMEWLHGKLLPISMDRIRSTPPLGVYWLAAVLRQHGHEADVLDLIALGEIDAPMIRAKAAQADLVGISCNTLNWPTARMVTNIVKMEYPDLPVVLGGIHPSGWPEHVLDRCPADFAILGEGEVPLVQLADALSGKGQVAPIPGLAYRDEHLCTVVNPNAGLAGVDDVEALPIPAYDLLPDGAYETISIESARGCKFKCTFCSTKFLGSWRGVSAENFVDRIEAMQPFLRKSRYGVFGIIDDLYTLDIARTKMITDLLEDRGLRIQATLDARATDIIRGDVAEALVPITNQMLIGAECGYDEGLRKIKKGCTVKVLEEAAQRLNALGIAEKCVFSFVIGFPFESAEDCRKTIAFATKLFTVYNTRVYLQWYNTIPGSAIWEGLEKDGAVGIWMYDDFGFFSNKHLFRAGVPLTLGEIKELSDVIRQLNTALLVTSGRDDIIQFASPDWLFHGETLDFPSHGVLENGQRPASASRSEVAGLTQLRS